MIPEAVAGWRGIVRTHDPGGLDALLADDIVFHSPVVHTPQRGKSIAVKYLTAAVAVLGENFRYVEEWTGSNSAALEFVALIEGIEINGVDIIGWNAEGKIDRFKVMVRPLKAIQILQQRMAVALAG